MKKALRSFEHSLLFQGLMLALFFFTCLMSIFHGYANIPSLSSGDRILFSIIGVGSLLSLFTLVQYLRRRQSGVKDLVKQIFKPLAKIRLLIYPLIGAGILVYLYTLFIRLNCPFEDYYQRAAVTLLLAFIIAALLKTDHKETPFNTLFLASLLAVGVCYQCGTYINSISSNPFTLSWSEGSRYYYASLITAQKLYGQQIPLSFLHPSRYLTMSVPFIAGLESIFLHRAWQVFLWIATTLICMIALVKRLKYRNFWWQVILVCSGFLFLQQGPVYYHLLICAIAVLIGFNKDKFWRSLIVVIFASLWAGISRINWYPLPGVLAALLYLLEKPRSEENTFWEYIKTPLLYIMIGLVFSLAANLAYIPLSGNANVEQFTTSFAADLLWNRLLPGPTYPKGILSGILWLCAPCLILLILRFYRKEHTLNKITRIFIVLALSIFFTGGLVVSVKIGGGSNLHNMDAFLLLLMTCVYYLEFTCLIDENKSRHTSPLRELFLILMLLQPFFWSLSDWSPRTTYSAESLQHDLQEINGTIASISDQSSESRILFINERQLLTFDYISDVELIPEYELLELMEMAISNQGCYLQQFYDRLAAHEFDLIVIDKQYINFKDEQDAFSEENNAWVRNITIPLMKYYTPLTWLRYTDTEIYLPRPAGDLQRLITR